MHAYDARRTAGGLLTAALLVALAACGDGITGSETPGGSPGGRTPPAVASVEVAPGEVQLLVDGTRALSATVRGATGAVLAGRQVEWTSSEPTIVRVDPNGNVTALREGTSIVTAASGGKQGQARIDVVVPVPAPVASVFVAGGGVDIEPGEVHQLAATLRAADGTLLSGRPVAWSSSDSTVIRVRPDGSVLGLRGGTVTITATSEGRSGSATLRIPDWLQFELRTANGAELPAEVEMSADTIEQTGFTLVTTEYRVRVHSGRLQLSTTDLRYRQLYELRTYRRTVSHVYGSVIVGPEEHIETRTVRDEGEATEYDVFTGDPIYQSTLFAGHGFRATRTAGRGRYVRQPIPGMEMAPAELLYAK